MADNDVPCDAVTLHANGRDGSIANQMDVDASLDVDTFFARIFGIDQLTVRRTAEAQYDPPLAMGSPANNLGDVPAGTCPADDDGTTTVSGTPCAPAPAVPDQNLWAQIQGPLTNKISGNAFTTQACSGSQTDYCGGSPYPNQDYDDDHASNPPRDGEYYSVVNDGGSFQVWIYDASYVDGGFQNGTGQPGVCGNNIRYDDGTPGGQPIPNYGFSNANCTGDQNQAGSCGVVGCDTNFRTKFELLAPDGTVSPFDNSSVVCSPAPVPGQSWSSLSTPDDYEGTLADYPHILDDQQKPFFQKWWRMCTVSGGEPGEYILHVTTPNAGVTGTNNFSIMALHSPPANVGTLQVFSRQRLPLFATKAPGGGGDVSPAKFYLARVLPSSHDRTLFLNFFDLGDSPTRPGFPEATGTLKLVPLNASFPGSGGITGCRWTGDASTDDPTGFGSAWASGRPWGPMSDRDNCRFTYRKSTWNGQWVTVQVPIPSGYSCGDPSVRTNCWIQLEVDPSANTFLSDATTWTAAMGGSPVRLVK